MLVRIRKHDPDPQEKARFSNLVIVKWEFHPAANGGPPTLAEVELMGQLEERLFSVFSETSDVGCGVAVFTIPGFRDWRFYTPDTQRFIEVFNQVMQGDLVYPIALEAFADPEWAPLTNSARGWRIEGPGNLPALKNFLTQIKAPFAQSCDCSIVATVPTLSPGPGNGRKR